MIISSDEQLRSIIPNLQRASASETPWVSRLDPFLQEAEGILEQYLCPVDILPEEALDVAARFVAFCAWRRAIPALDVVATASGFGVVSNQTVAPASKERVEAAVRAATVTESRAACTLLYMLWQNENWREAPVSARYNSIFPHPERFARFCGKDELGNLRNISAFDLFLELQPRIRTAEIVISKIISRAAMRALRSVAAKDAMRQPVCEESLYLLDLVSAMAAKNIGGLNIPPRDIADLYDIMDGTIEDDADGIVAAWRNSAIFRAYKSNSFQNEKNSPGFFF